MVAQLPTPPCFSWCWRAFFWWQWPEEQWFFWVLWLGAVSLATTLTADEAFWISVVCMLMCGRQGAVYFDGAVASEAVLSFKHERVIMVEVCGRRRAVFSGEAVANEAVLSCAHEAFNCSKTWIVGL